MAVLTTYTDTQPLTTQQQADNLAFLLERFQALFGGNTPGTVSPTVSNTV